MRSLVPEFSARTAPRFPGFAACGRGRVGRLRLVAELARRQYFLNRVAVKVAPSGKVLSTEVLGGHPLLAQVAVDAVQQWRFEPAPQETEEVVVFTFVP